MNSINFSYKFTVIAYLLAANIAAMKVLIMLYKIGLGLVN